MVDYRSWFGYEWRQGSQSNGINKVRGLVPWTDSLEYIFRLVVHSWVRAASLSWVSYQRGFLYRPALPDQINIVGFGTHRPKV